MIQPATGSTDKPTPECGKTNIASAEYGTRIHPTSGPPGTEVTFTGTTLRGEDWKWAPSDRIEAWWNTDAPASEVPGGTPLRDGPVLRLVQVDDMEQCRFETTFTVPDVEPGRYKISVFSWFTNPQDGYGLFLPHHFTVTDSQPPRCEDEHAKSYGEEPPGLWLKDVLLELGAPGGHPLSQDDVGDTGTALVIDIPEYGNDPTVYVTMLTPGIDPNVTESETEKEIGRRHGYVLYLDKGNGWETYNAVSDKWQLALIAYPGADQDQVTWPERTVEWLEQAVDIAEGSPPQCEGPIT